MFGDFQLNFDYLFIIGIKEKLMKKHGFQIFNVVILFGLFAFLFGGAARAQTCRTPTIKIIVSDKKGEIIDPTVLEMPKYTEANVEIVSYFDDRGNAKPIKVINIKGRPDCRVQLETLILKHRGQTMKLIFNVEVVSYGYGSSKNLRPVAASSMTFRLPPFQNGAFEYVWQNPDEKILEGWKKISETGGETNEK